MKRKSPEEFTYGHEDNDKILDCNVHYCHFGSYRL